MLHLIPAVKHLTVLPGTLSHPSVFCPHLPDPRLENALRHLPQEEAGVPLTIRMGDGSKEGYRLTIEPDRIEIESASPAGAFYALQTLRQIFMQSPIPCLVIEDEPDFPYRGFYHDVTRGKVPTLSTLKELVERMAFFKLNSLQLYVEHVYEFEETRDVTPHTSCLTAQELRELDTFCREHFIDFIPSLSTFGHMYEILQQPRYHKLRTLKDFPEPDNFWNARMAHHTIDPTHPKSFPLVQSLIDQYAPQFTSPRFNICCDETFDLRCFEQEGQDVGRLYVDFVKKIIAHLQESGKTVMMWADILLQHPEVISELPEDTVFLNWQYSADPKESHIAALAELNRQQIVCPGTSTWNRFCEDVQTEEANISRMAQYGKKYGALGILNTNWGDWGNPCSLELSHYGLALGAAKSWAQETEIDAIWDAAVDALVYQTCGALDLLRRLSQFHSRISWMQFCRDHFAALRGDAIPCPYTAEAFQAILEEYCKLHDEVLTLFPDPANPYRREMCLALDILRLMAEISYCRANEAYEMQSDAPSILTRLRSHWLAANKESELRNLEWVLGSVNQNSTLPTR